MKRGYTKTAMALHWGSAAIMLLGLVQLPPLVGADQDQSALAKLVHTWTVWFCGTLIVGHVGMALKHHFLDRDDVLTGRRI